VQRRSWLFRAFIAVVLAGIANYLPAELARRATAPNGNVDFASRPLEGWKFLIEVATDGPSARAGSPGEAREIALAAFDDGRVRPSRVDLLWLPDSRIRVRTEQGSRDLATNSRLVWRVTGQVVPGARSLTVGLIDFASGVVIYDARVAER
jgi:hypothetical protein